MYFRRILIIKLYIFTQIRKIIPRIFILAKVKKFEQKIAGIFFTPIFYTPQFLHFLIQFFYNKNFEFFWTKKFTFLREFIRPKIAFYSKLVKKPRQKWQFRLQNLTFFEIFSNFLVHSFWFDSGISPPISWGKYSFGKYSYNFSILSFRPTNMILSCIFDDENFL